MSTVFGNSGKTPRATIGIPTYTRSWGLRRAIDSALRQTRTDFELVIADDASTDDTEAVVRGYSDPRIRYFRQPRNVGMVANWGKCVELAQGEFFTFLADDDILRSTFLENRIAPMESSDKTLVFSRYDVCDKEGIKQKTVNADWTEPRKLFGREFVDAVLAQRVFVGTALYRLGSLRAKWPKVQDDDLVLDFGLNLRFALGERHAALYLPVNDFTMTAHAEQNTHKFGTKVATQFVECLDRILAGGVDDPGPLRVARAQWFVSWGRWLMEHGERAEARRRFKDAIRSRPLLAQGWTQYLKTYL